MTSGSDQTLLDTVRAAAGDDERLPCARAFAIADELDVRVAEVGRACNDLGIKIVGCQLGCF